MKTLFAIAAMLVCHSAAAQLFKCTDAAGKTTYSSTKCSEMGMKDAGEIKDRLQITPAPPPSRLPARSSTSSSSGEQAQPVPASGEAAKEPDRRCFTVRNAKGGTFTRCNDKPDEPAQ